MRPLLYFILLCILISCQSSTPTTSGWQLVYKNDVDGKALFGDKTQLVDAVRLGYPIRIGWGSSRIEHVATVDFLTIFNGEEVFAQIKPIVGQRPQVSGDSLKISFRTNNNWVKMAGTNGFSASLMTDYMQDTIVGGGERYTATTWYVNYPANPAAIKARPLWRANAPLWKEWEKKSLE